MTRLTPLVVVTALVVGSSGLAAASGPAVGDRIVAFRLGTHNSFGGAHPLPAHTMVTTGRPTGGAP